MGTGRLVTFSALDWAVVAVYFVVIAGIAIWAALGKEKDTEDYFLASRDAGWFLIGSSIFASNIGAEHLVGLAGTGASSGMAFAHWELHSYLCVALGWVFAPFYLRSGVFTTPEFLEKRYTPATRTVLSLISWSGLRPDQGLGDHLRRRDRDLDHPRLPTTGRRSTCRCWGPPTTSGSRPSRWSSSPAPTP